MATYTLTHTRTGVTRDIGGDIGASPGGWGFHVANRTLRSLATDTVELEIVPDDFSDTAEPRAASWVYGDNVVITSHDPDLATDPTGTKWFEGELGDSTRDVSDSNHIIAWTINGPWQALEELQYQQSYATTRDDGGAPAAAVQAEVTHGEVTLMQRYDYATDTVTVIKTGEQIGDILSYAAGRTTTPLFTVTESAPPVYDDIDAGIYVDFVQARDETCANLIRNLSRWMPLATSWFDYTTTPPTIHFAEPTGTAIDIDMTALPDGVAVSITEQESLVVPYVRIAYKILSHVNVDDESQVYTDIETDVFPANADTTSTDHRRALLATVDLAGANTTIQTQRVRTRTIPWSHDLTAPTVIANRDPALGALPAADDPPSGGNWLDNVREFCAQEGRLPWLADIAPTGDIDSNIGVIEFAVMKQDTDGVDAFPAGDEDPVYDLWDTPRILDRGTTTADWMDVKTQAVKVRVKLVFKGAARKGRNVRQHFTTNDPADPNFRLPMYEGEFNLVATDAVSKTYTDTTSGNAAETPPTGIAEKLYDDLSILRHTGTIRYSEDEFPTPGTWRPGKLVDITNSSNAAWTTMAGMVQQVKESIKTRTTTLSIGTPNHLGINDFLTLARLWRRNPPSFTDETERKTGKRAEGKGNKVKGGETGPKENAVDINKSPRNGLVAKVQPNLT